MATPKSKKLASELAAGPNVATLESLKMSVAAPAETIQIREIACLNDMVAIMQFEVKSTILSTAESFKNEGIVVGVGPGLVCADGSRTPSQLSIGDVVMFAERQIASEISTPADSPSIYAGKKIVMISERSLICLLPPVSYEVVEPLVVKPWMQTVDFKAYAKAE